MADRLLELNAAGPIHLTRACLPFMVRCLWNALVDVA